MKVKRRKLKLVQKRLEFFASIDVESQSFAPYYTPSKSAAERAYPEQDDDEAEKAEEKKDSLNSRCQRRQCP